jgi:hypothetical protein
MDEETAKEMRSLAAETLALKVVVARVLYRITKTDPQLDEAISLGFAEAASLVENRVIKLGEPTPTDYIVEALRVVEELPSTTIGDRTQPKHIV